ncbi:hypothetical protein LZ31DRAFT_48951 [Colletotrichum somersetense]|nr:hypothetical protein LZ31DRAFT_48951 [Colletotrichum somersetense]
MNFCRLHAPCKRHVQAARKCERWRPWPSMPAMASLCDILLKLSFSCVGPHQFCGTLGLSHTGQSVNRSSLLGQVNASQRQSGYLGAVSAIGPLWYQAPRISERSFKVFVHIRTTRNASHAAATQAKRMERGRRDCFLECPRLAFASPNQRSVRQSAICTLSRNILGSLRFHCRCNSTANLEPPALRPCNSLYYSYNRTLLNFLVRGFT